MKSKFQVQHIIIVLYSCLLHFCYARNANEFYTFKQATATSVFIAPNNDYQKFGPNRAFQIGLSYWCSKGNHSDKEFVSWTGELWDVAKVAQIEIHWEYAPKEIEISMSLTGDNFHVVLPFTETAGDHISYKEVLTLQKPFQGRFVRLTLRTSLHEYFGIRYVHVIGAGDPLFAIKSGITSPQGEMCLQLENGKVENMTRVVLDLCSHAIAAADGRELWRQDSRQRIFSAISIPPKYLTSSEPSQGGHIVIQECNKNDGDESFSWEFMGNSQIASKNSHNQCLTQVDQYGNKPGMGNLLENFKDTVKVFSNGSSAGHEEKYLHDGDLKSYWASLLFPNAQPHNTTVTFDFGTSLHATRVKIDWEYQPFSYLLEASEDNIVFKPVASNLSNNSHITIDALDVKEFKQLRLVMLRPHHTFGKAAGGYIYGIREIEILAPNMITSVGECKSAANSDDSRDKYFVTYVNNFDVDLSQRVSSMENDLHDDITSIMEGVADLHEKIDEADTCMEEKKEFDEEITRCNSTEMMLWSRVQKSQCDIGKPTVSFLSQLGESINNAAEDCYAIKAHEKHATSGFYWIIPKCAKHPIRVYCDMESQTSIYVWDGRQPGSTPQSLHLLRSPQSIRYQCASFGLEPLVVKTQHHIHSIKQALHLMSVDASSGSIIPLGYKFENEGVYRDLMNRFTFLKDHNNTVASRVNEPKPEAGTPELNYNAAGLSLVSGELEYFDLESASLAAIVCSTNYTTQHMKPVDIKCDDKLGKSDSITGGLNTNILVNCVEDCRANSEYIIYGTDGVYSDSSYICRAAIHSGVIVATGSFTVSVESGLPYYNGSTENGIASLAYNVKTKGLLNLLSNEKDALQQHNGPDAQYSIRILPLEVTCPIVDTHGSFLQIQDPVNKKGEASKDVKTENLDNGKTTQAKTENDFDLLNLDPTTRAEVSKVMNDIDSLYGVDPKTVLSTIERIAHVVATSKKHLKPLDSLQTHQQRQSEILFDRVQNLSNSVHHLKEDSEAHRIFFENLLADELQKPVEDFKTVNIDYKTMPFDKTFTTYDTSYTSGGTSNWGYSNSELEGRFASIVQHSDVDASEDGEGSFAFLKGVSYYDFVLDVDVLAKNDGKIGIAFRVLDKFNMYLLVLDSVDGSKRLFKMQNGVTSILATNKDEGYNKHKWLHINISADGYNIKITSEGSLILSVLDSVFEHGGFALYTCGRQGYFAFDKFTVKPTNGPSDDSAKRLARLDNLKCGTYLESFHGDLSNNYEVVTPLPIRGVYWGYYQLHKNNHKVIIQRNAPADTLNIGSLAILKNDLYCRQGHFYFRAFSHSQDATIGAVVLYKDDSNMVLVELSKTTFRIRWVNGERVTILAKDDDTKMVSGKWINFEIVIGDKEITAKCQISAQQESKLTHWFTSADKALVAKIANLDNLGKRVGIKVDNCRLCYFDNIKIMDEPNLFKDAKLINLLQRFTSNAYAECISSTHILSRVQTCEKMYRNSLHVQNCSKDFCTPCCKYHASLLGPQYTESCIDHCNRNSKTVESSTSHFLKYVFGCTSFKGNAFQHCDQDHKCLQDACLLCCSSGNAHHLLDKKMLQLEQASCMKQCLVR